MAFNKIAALRANIAAIKEAINPSALIQGASSTNEILRKYCGFGPIGEIHNIDRYKTDEDVKANIDNLSPAMAECLHELYLTLKEDLCDGDEEMLHRVIESIKENQLTAFYTPNEVVEATRQAIEHCLGCFGVKAVSFLDPSSGIGQFLNAAPEGCRQVAFEIDMVTAKILAALHPNTEVHAKGFEEIDKVMPDREKFDVTASNIPFAQLPVHDAKFEAGDEVHRRSLKMVHRYFFVKALEELEEGGILAFVTSRGIADTQSVEYLRKWLMEKGNLLTAIRLPDNLFMSGSGIEVGSDLIVVQRDSHKGWTSKREQMFIESVTKCIVVDGKSAQVENVNRLLSQRNRAIFTHRRLETNKYGKMVCSYFWRDDMSKFQYELAELMKRDMELNFRTSAWRYGHDEERKRREREEREKRQEQLRKSREERERKLNEMRPYYEGLRASFNNLQSRERRDKQEAPFLREALNAAYDVFVSKFGTIHHNEKLIEEFDEPQLMLSLERKEHKMWVKADVFFKPTAFHKVADDETITPMEALAMSLNEYGIVKMTYIGQLTHKSEDEVYEALRGEIFYYPDKDDDPESFLTWQHKSRCINGNVLAKSKVIQRYCEGLGLSAEEKRYVQDTYDALVAAIPTPIEFDDIDIVMGSRWLPTKFYDRYVNTVLFPDMKERANEEIKIIYTPEIDQYSFEWPRYSLYTTAGLNGPWSVKDQGYNGLSILEYAIKNDAPDIQKSITFMDKDGSFKKGKMRDEEACRKVQEKITQMRDQFEEFIHDRRYLTDEEREEIKTIYNEKMNCSIRADFDGGMQTFPGLDFSKLGFTDLYQSQKDAIWMIKTLHGGNIWHEVGGGKTMIMCVAAFEMHRLGLCNKPLIIAMTANVQQIADTFRKAYPQARVLYPGKGDFKKEKRKQVIEQIANNDWDCIILSHDQFWNKIPQDPAMQRGIIEEELRDLEEAERLAHINGTLTKDAARGLAQRKKSLRNQLDKLLETQKKNTDDVLNFHELGIDFIFVDESHEFKNLPFQTSHTRVKGVGSTDAGPKNMALFTAIRDIQKRTGRDMGAVFLSGTLIVNALTELFVNYKYLRPKELLRQGMHAFDAWAATFTKKTIDYDLDVNCQIVSQERFRQYLNVPELSSSLREITDFRNAEMINLDRPKENIIEDFCDPTPEQQMLIERLIEFGETHAWSTLGLTEKEQPSKLESTWAVTLNRFAREISLDVRLLGEHQFSDHPDNKINRCAANVAKRYHEFNDHLGVQMIFCDQSIPKKEWNVHQELKEVLNQVHGIPLHEIALIHDYDTPTRRAKLFDDLNAGRVRIVVGTTKKLGTGVNAQQRVVAVHHLDLPWRPSDLEQRNGRAIRTGNEVKIWGGNKVDIIIYGTNRSSDAYMFKTLQNKAFFIKQINQGTCGTRHYDEGSMTSDGSIPYAELVANLSGNMDLLEKAKIDGKVGVLEKSLKAFKAEMRSAEGKIDKNRKEIENLRRVIALQDGDVAAAEAFLKAHDGNVNLNVNGSKDSTPEELTKRLVRYRDETRDAYISNGGKIIGSCYDGWPIKIETTFKSVSLEYAYNTFYVKGPSGIYYKCNKNGTIGVGVEQVTGCWANLPNAIRMRIADNQTGIRTREAEIKVCEVTLQQKWSHEDELADLRRQQAELTERVNAYLAERDAKKQQSASK